MRIAYIITTYKDECSSLKTNTANAVDGGP